MRETNIQSALDKKHPDPVALVTCTGRDGKENLFAVGWFMQASLKPKLLAISVGRTRLSHSLISDSKEFVLCLPSSEQAEAVLYCGTRSGRNVDKFAETGLEKLKAKQVRAPLLGGSVACFECKVVNKVETGDHTLFIGEILEAYVPDNTRKGVLYDFGGGILNGLRFNPQSLLRAVASSARTLRLKVGKR